LCGLQLYAQHVVKNCFLCLSDKKMASSEDGWQVQDAANCNMRWAQDRHNLHLLMSRLQRPRFAFRLVSAMLCNRGKHWEFNAVLTTIQETEYGEWSLESESRDWPELCGNRQVGFLAVELDDKNIDFVSPELLDDKQFMLDVITKVKPTLLYYASERLRGDTDVVLAAVAGASETLADATDELVDDEDFISELKARFPDVWLRVYGKQTREVFDTSSFDYTHYRPKPLVNTKHIWMRYDRQIVYLNATQLSPIEFKFAAFELCNDKQFVTKLLGVCTTRIMQYASRRLRDNKPFVTTLLGFCNANILRYTSKRLRSDKELVLTAVSRGEHAIKYATKELFNDKAFQAEVKPMLSVYWQQRFGLFLEEKSKTAKKSKARRKR
jgi:hypothetical protein